MTVLATSPVIVDRFEWFFKRRRLWTENKKTLAHKRVWGSSRS